MSLTIKFVGLEPNEQPPTVALFQLNASGQVVRKIAVAKEGKLDIDPNLVKEGLAALGPDVEDPAMLERNALMQFRVQERLAEWQRTNVIQIPRDWWLRWRFFIVCVNGRVRKCFLLFREPIATFPFPRPIIPFPWPRLCWPICNGVVEIYERTCCCRPPIIVDIPKIIDKLREVAGPVRPWPPHPNPPDPGPEGFTPESIMDRVAMREVKRMEAFEEINYAAPPNEQLHADLEAVQKMQPAEAVKYLGERDYLWPIWCRCSTRKVGEAVLGPDGRFHFCYIKFPRPGVFCRTLYFYKVKQWQDTQFVTIYDGEAAHRYYTAAEFADITTFLGRSCGSIPPPPTGAKPNVMLQDIGLTHSYSLKSPTQTGELSVAAPGADSGLVEQSWASDAPWGDRLSFRLFFHPGLKALGAVYYRLSVVAADANGGPVGIPAPLIDPVSWLKFVAVGGHYSVESEPLGPFTKTVGANLITGLYKIPYDDTIWLGGQYHQSLNTTIYANARHLLVLEVFDGSGNRLRPTGAAGAGTDTGFEFQRWLKETDPGSVAAMPFAALTHLLWFDNRPCYADIVDLRKGHVPNTQECQFMSGPATTEFSVGFRAFHVQPGFMYYFDLSYHRGLNGPTRTFEHGTTNQGLPLGGPPAESVPNVPTPPPPTPPLTFGSMLDSTTVGAKCTFAVNLNVYGKHTNGFGRLSGYDRYDQAAFALEIT